jgi:hypothetical protein
MSKKGLSPVLSLWGIISYLQGALQKNKRRKQASGRIGPFSVVISRKNLIIVKTKRTKIFSESRSNVHGVHTLNHVLQFMID